MMGGIFDQLGGKVIAVVGVAVVSSMLIAVLAMTKSANIPQELMYMTMRIQQMYFSAHDYSGIDNATIIKAGVVPEHLIKGSSIKHAFNGEITVAPGTSNETFTFSLNNIPKDECVTLATSKMNKWRSVAVNGSVISADSISFVSDIVAACAENSVLIFEAE